MTIETKIDELAEHVADLAMGGKSKEVPFSEKIDALKTLISLYAIKRKHKDKADDGDSEANFDRFAKELEKTNGEAAVGSHRGRGHRQLPAPFGDI